MFRTKRMSEDTMTMDSHIYTVTLEIRSDEPVRPEEWSWDLPPGAEGCSAELVGVTEVPYDRFVAYVD